MTERTSDVHFQRKVSRRYRGSHCDLEINFNAPLRRYCVTLPLPFSFFRFSSRFFFVFFLVSTPCFLLSTSCCDDIRTDTWACGAPGPRKPVHMEKKDVVVVVVGGGCVLRVRGGKGGMEGGGGIHKRFITNVSNPLLHCQGDVIKHTL